jgi:hypothetical protein
VTPNPLPELASRYFWLVFVFVVIDLLLRGLALYRSARAGQKIWFIALLIINSLGLLPTIYLLTHRRS